MEKKQGTRAESVRRPRAAGGATRARRKPGASNERGYERDGNGSDHGPSLVKRVGSALDEKLGDMDIEKALILLHTALAVALVIKQSRDRGPRRKAEPLRSAMSVLNYYLNEGRDLSETQRATLEDIKKEMRSLYRREDEEVSPAT